LVIETALSTLGEFVFDSVGCIVVDGDCVWLLQTVVDEDGDTLLVAVTFRRRYSRSTSGPPRSGNVHSWAMLGPAWRQPKHGVGGGMVALFSWRPLHFFRRRRQRLHAMRPRERCTAGGGWVSASSIWYLGISLGDMLIPAKSGKLARKRRCRVGINISAGNPGTSCMIVEIRLPLEPLYLPAVGPLIEPRSSDILTL
jgi:hypothetical protein